MLERASTAFRALPVALQVPLAVIAGVVALGIGTALGAVVAPAEDREQPSPVLTTAPAETTTSTPSTTSTTSTTLPPTTSTAAPTTTTTTRAVTTTAAPATTRATVPATTTTARTTACSPAYPTVCIPPPPPDLDCGDIAHRRFTVLPPDPHGFDGNDKDGLGCESG